MAEIKYQKNGYNHTDNTKYITNYEYKPETIVERIFNPVTEQYEYKERTINHKLDWENTEEALKTNLLIEKEDKE